MGYSASDVAGLGRLVAGTSGIAQAIRCRAEAPGGCSSHGATEGDSHRDVMLAYVS